MGTPHQSCWETPCHAPAIGSACWACALEGESHPPVYCSMAGWTSLPSGCPIGSCMLGSSHWVVAPTYAIESCHGVVPYIIPRNRAIMLSYWVRHDHAWVTRLGDAIAPCKIYSKVCSCSYCYSCAWPSVAHAAGEYTQYYRQENMCRQQACRFETDKQTDCTGKPTHRQTNGQTDGWTDI